MDTENYKSITVDITVTVSKAVPEYTVPTDLTSVYSPKLTLANINLPDGFSWNEPDTKLCVPGGEYKAIYSISLSPNLQQIREMLDGLFKKLPANAKPLFHSDQGWQYQHSEYQRLLSEHNIVQSMSRKGNCMDNGAMENFFGRLKVEMFYGEKFESVKAFIDELKRYIDYYNNERISLKLKGMSPVQYRTHSQAS